MQRLHSSSPTKASVFALVCVYITLEKLETKFTLLVTKKSESIVDVVIACDSKLLLAAAGAVTLAKRPFSTGVNFTYQAYPAYPIGQRLKSAPQEDFFNVAMLR